MTHAVKQKRATEAVTRREVRYSCVKRTVTACAGGWCRVFPRERWTAFLPCGKGVQSIHVMSHSAKENVPQAVSSVVSVKHLKRCQRVLCGSMHHIVGVMLQAKSHTQGQTCGNSIVPPTVRCANLAC